MKVVIIGNGIAGTTCARFVRKLDSSAEILIISAESEHFFSRTALMYMYMGHMGYEQLKPYEDHFWPQNRIDLLYDRVERIDFDSKALHTTGTGKIGYDKLVLAVGSKYNKFGWPGQDLTGVHGMVSLQDLQEMERLTEQGIRRAVVVGGGLIGIEVAEMYHSRNFPVTLMVREDSYWSKVLPAPESQMVNRQITEAHIDLRLSTELDRIEDDGRGRVAAVVTKSGERIPCDTVALTAGVRPNIDFLKDSPLQIDRGILVDDYLRTSIPDVYALGDCMQVREPQPGRQAIEAVWYVGRISGETAAYNLCGRTVPYRPGIWFNSAKFIQLEYQIYGEAPAKLPDHLHTLYWEHPKGDKAIRINYDAATKAVRGFHLMGQRYRQEVCEKWIAEETHIEEVLPRLGMANFDPELYKQYDHELVAQYNQENGTSLQLRQRRGLPAVLRFLAR